MTKTTALALPALLVSALAGTALAQPSAAPPPPPPPPPGTVAPQPAPPPIDQTEAQYPQNDVSNINGVPVPVGEHNEYHYTFKRWNISANPLGWVFGIYGASLSYGLNQNIAIRGDINLFAPPNSSLRGSEVGVGLPIYFRRTYQGLFLEPGIISRTFDDGGDTAVTAGPQVLIGWHWMWDSGLNFAMAFGAGRNFSSSNNSDSSYDDSEPFANGYIRFGYAF